MCPLYLRLKAIYNDKASGLLEIPCIIPVFPASSYTHLCNLLLAVFSGCAGVAVGHPLDTVKVRLMLSSSTVCEWMNDHL